MCGIHAGEVGIDQLVSVDEYNSVELAASNLGRELSEELLHRARHDRRLMVLEQRLRDTERMDGCGGRHNRKGDGLTSARLGR